MPESPALDVVLRYVRALAGGDAARYLTDDAVVEKLGARLSGELGFTVTNALVDGARVAVEISVTEKTMLRGAMALVATLRDGRIAELRQYVCFTDNAS